jgi:hypothetical protein
MNKNENLKAQRRASLVIADEIHEVSLERMQAAAELFEIVKRSLCGRATKLFFRND